MAYCAKCGAALQGRFCASCGTAANAAAPGMGESRHETSPAVALDDNVASAMCYLLLGITGLLFLVLEPYSLKRTIRFHALQSIFFTGALAVCWVVLIVAGVILAYIPIVGGLIAMMLFLAMLMGAFIAWIMLMYKAFNNQSTVLPIIGPLAEKQA